MKEYDLLLAIGDIDDVYIERIYDRLKKRGKQFPISRRFMRVLAACFLFGLLVAGVGLILRTGESKPSTETTEFIPEPSVEAPALSPMIYVNGIRYVIDPQDTSFEQAQETFVYIGKIQSVVESYEEPHEEFQANYEYLMGVELYQYGDDIVAFSDGRYRLYTKQ